MQFIKLTNWPSFAVVDDDMYDYLNQFSWHNGKGGYAVTSIPGNSQIYMHHLVIGYPINRMETDHINRNTHDNQKHNLRHVTHAQNMQNKKPKASTKFLGVFYIVERGKWRAKIKKDNVVYHIGYFYDDTTAALAYNKKAIELYGERATLNQV